MGYHSNDLSMNEFSLLLVFRVTPFRINQNNNQNRSIDKIQNRRKERRQLCKYPRQNSGHSKFSNGRYAEKLFTQIYRDLYRDGMLVPVYVGHQHGDRKPSETSVTEFCYKRVNLCLEGLKSIKKIFFLKQELFR